MIAEATTSSQPRPGCRRSVSSLLRDFSQRLAGQLSATLAVMGNRVDDAPGILIYHRVAERMAGFAEPTINVTPAQFRRQLMDLQRQSYQFWPLRRLLDHAHRGLSIPPHVVVVTFDDGHASVFASAFPVLQELQIPATVFVNTAFLDSREPFPFDRWGLSHAAVFPAESWQALTTEQCLAMQASGLVELGAHTHTHGDFRGRVAEFEEDLRTNVEKLNARFGIDSPTFAFPFGRWRHGYVTHELMEAARRVGVQCALTTECQCVDVAADPFGWGRFNVYDFDSARTIAARLKGWYGWAPRSQDLLADWWQGRRSPQEACA